jgi:hypothetical protein
VLCIVVYLLLLFFFFLPQCVSRGWHRGHVCSGGQCLSLWRPPWQLRDSYVNIVTGYGLEDRGLIPSRDKDYFLSYDAQTTLGLSETSAALRLERETVKIMYRLHLSPRLRIDKHLRLYCVITF